MFFFEREIQKILNLVEFPVILNYSESRIFDRGDIFEKDCLLQIFVVAEILFYIMHESKKVIQDY